MDERQIGLILTLKEAGLPPEVSDFSSRLILQKAVYLLEEAGIRLGYSFNWYLRGPYSPGLTRDLYDFASKKEDAAGWVLDGQSKSIVDRLRTLLVEPSEDPAAKARRLELLASLHYLARRRRLSVDDDATATAQLAANGKHFSPEEVAGARSDLKQVGLL